MRRAGLLSLTLAVLAGAAPLAEGAPRPPHLRPPDDSSAEAGLWRATDKAELAAKTSGERLIDPALEGYAHEVECKIAPEYCDDTRIYLMSRPFFNASMAANGYMEVHSGFMLRVRDEAEFAFVLGHETGHFAENHILENRAALKRRMNEAMILEVGIAAAGIYVGTRWGAPQTANDFGRATGELMNLAYMAELAAYYRYGRNQETEADRLGFERLTAAGYDPSAAASIWRSVLEERAHSDFESERKTESRADLFASHPITLDRIKALADLASAKPMAGDRGRDRYRAAIRPFLTRWLREDLRRRDYGETLMVIAHLSEDNLDAGVLNFFRGECYRLRRGVGDGARAIGAYEDAARFADAPPETWRELGGMYQREGRTSDAVVAFNRYIDRSPQAQDRWVVETTLKSLSQTGDR